MKFSHQIAAAACILVSGHVLAQSPVMDKELSDLTEQLATKIKDHGKKKVTVLDFTDLQGASSELGRYIAQEMTVNFVSTNRDFAVLDRANLKSILAEHKLTAEGLVDPENAKKLGQFAGVDALILGKIVPLGQTIELTATVITTDTAEVVGGARARFKSDETVQQLLSQTTTAAAADGGAPAQEEPKVVKTFGDLRIEMPPLQIVNGKEYILTFDITNTSLRKSLWIAVNTDMGSNLRVSMTAADGNQCGSNWNLISGVAFTAYQNGNMFRATEVPPHDVITASIKFGSGRPATEGTCHVQVELLIGRDFNGTYGEATIHTLMADLKAK